MTSGHLKNDIRPFSMADKINKKIAVLPGDGIGPEVTHQAVKVLRAIGEKYGHTFELQIGGEAIESHGSPLPDETIQLCTASDAVLLGAVGMPKYDNDPDAKVRPEQGLLALRKVLGLYINIRPVEIFSSMKDHSALKEDRLKDVEFVIYRELGSGIYFGERQEATELEDGSIEAYDKCSYTRQEVERIVTDAMKAARRRQGKVCVVDKANVLASSRLWRKTATEIAANYPDVEVTFMYVDNAAMQLVLQPNQFDVIVTSNMFGDILSDLGSAITGSLGVLPSASIGDSSALFEPVHGSYPQAAGKDIANPIAAILSVSQMLDHFGMKKEAFDVRTAVRHCVNMGLGTPDMHATHELGCGQMGDMIAMAVHEGEIELKQFQRSAGVSTII